MSPMRKLLNSKIFYKPADAVLGFVTVPAMAWLRMAKYIGISKLPVTQKMLNKVGVFPIVDHYYEPLFRFDRLQKGNEVRELPLDWNDEEQLAIIDQFHYQKEFETIPHLPDEQQSSNYEYFWENGSYLCADAEYLYSLIRYKKPKRIIEIGSGFSTRMMKKAVAMNEQENPSHKTHITCVEPYEMEWLEKINVEVIRERVEDISLARFKELGEGDILFIDSSHMIRPQGDVLYEFFTILPVLQKGVIVHIHDIFSPFDYPSHWMTQEYRMWNEQYLLEAFLMYNRQFKIIGALSYLGYKYADFMDEKFPNIQKNANKKGCAMWLQKL